GARPAPGPSPPRPPALQPRRCPASPQAGARMRRRNSCRGQAGRSCWRAGRVLRTIGPRARCAQASFRTVRILGRNAMAVPGMPSLDLVRGFVAVGRRMSITLAARDLFLTQSAVSRQIHALEEQLGVPLFTRGYRSIAFTPEGERLFRSADAAIGQLQDALGELATHRRARPVTLSTTI